MRIRAERAAGKKGDKAKAAAAAAAAAREATPDDDEGSVVVELGRRGHQIGRAHV